MTLTPTGYRPRVIDAKLNEYLTLFGAVSIEGPKWCGKTWTASSHAESFVSLMDPAGNYLNRQQAEIDPSLVLTGDTPRVLDEWQEVPSIWDAVRFSVDQTAQRGLYLLTGSTTPPRKKYRHSGAGRIALLEMRSMSLYESGDSGAQISLESLLAGESIRPVTTDFDVQHLVELTLRGGWPESLTLPKAHVHSVAQQYLKAVTKNELFESETSRRDPKKLEKLLLSLARNNATIANNATLVADTTGAVSSSAAEQPSGLSRSALDDYLADLKKIFLIEELPAWSPALRSRTRVRATPKRLFTDPSLAIAALGVSQAQLQHDLNTFGFMFENLCLRDLAIYARALDGSLFHYRDNSGLEVDAIVELNDAQWAAFEIKLGQHQTDKAAASLRRLKEKMTNAHLAPPVCLGVITGGGLGYTREDGVHVIPINALCP